MNYSHLPFPVSHYVDMVSTWPEVGNIFLGNFDKESIVLYLSTTESKAKFITENRSFRLDYNYWKIDWNLCPTFFTIVHDTDWAKIPEKSGILALTITRQGFEEILTESIVNRSAKIPEIVLDWVQERDPFGHLLDRSSLKIRISKGILERFLDEWLLRIDNITYFVRKQRKTMLSMGAIGQLVCPDEVPYELLNTNLREEIGMDMYDVPPIPDQGLFLFDGSGAEVEINSAIPGAKIRGFKPHLPLAENGNSSDQENANLIRQQEIKESPQEINTLIEARLRKRGEEPELHEDCYDARERELQFDYSGEQMYEEDENDFKRSWRKVKRAIREKSINDEEFERVRVRNRPKFNIYD